MPAGFNVSQFKANVNYTNDILRNNRFRMEFSLPVVMTNSQEARETVRYMEYWCEVSAQPGINFLTTDARKYTFGPLQKRPYVSTFNDLAVTFYDDGKGTNWRFFNDWMREINKSPLATDGTRVETAFVYPYELRYRTEYVTDTKLYVYDNEGNAVKIIQFRDMYPVGISDSPLNWSDTNSLLRFTVNLHFLEWWEVTIKEPFQPEERTYYKTKPATQP